MILMMPNDLMRAKARASFASFLANEWPGLLVAIVALMVYSILSPDYILGGDNGEFAALSRSDGIAHPPGYPLYTLYLRSMSWLPGTGAKSAALATAMLGGLQVLVLYLCCRKWQIGVVASSVAVAFYASSPLAITLNTHAEVFALNNLLAASLLLACAPCSVLKAQYATIAAGLILGLGFSHHHTIVFLLPVVLAFLVMSLHNLGKSQIVFRLASFMGACAIGLLPNLLLFHWSDLRVLNSNSWADISSIDDFVHHFLRRDYGTFNLGGGRRVVDLIGHQKLLLKSLYWSWSIMLIPAVVGYFSLFFRYWRRPVRMVVLWLALALSTLIAGPIFVTRFNILIAPPGLAIFERFYFLPSLLIAIPVARGLDQIGCYCVRFRSSGKPTSSWGKALARPLDVVVTASLVLFSFCFNGSIARAAYSDRVSRLVNDSLKSSLQSMPRGAIVFASADHRIFGYLYLSLSERLRPDVTVVTPSLLKYRWYRIRYGLDAKNSSAAMALLLRRSFQDRRPVLVDSGVSPRFKGFKTFQFGLFRRVLPSSGQVPAPGDLMRLNQDLFRGMIRPRRSLSGDGWARIVEEDMANSWISLSKDLKSMGRPDLEKVAVQMSRVLGPCASIPCPTFPGR